MKVIIMSLEIESIALFYLRSIITCLISNHEVSTKGGVKPLDNVVGCRVSEQKKSYTLFTQRKTEFKLSSTEDSQKYSIILECNDGKVLEMVQSAQLSA